METVDGVQSTFRASWRSSAGVMLALMLLFTLGAFGFAVALPRGPLLLGVGGAVFFGWLSWLIGRQLVSKKPLLIFDQNGITAHFFKGRTLPWSVVRDVRAESVQGNMQLVIDVLPSAQTHVKPAWLGKKTERRIPLHALRAKNHRAAADAALAAFALHGGAQAARAVEAHAQVKRAADDLNVKLSLLTPTTWALYVVVGVNVLVWLANVLSGMDVLKPLTADLLRWGGNSAASVVEDHEYWRLLTATFLHGGLLHIALNMFGLWEAGKLLNRFYGNAPFLLIYFSSALVGSALSLHFSAQQAVSVGASGAVFGVLGALLVTMVRHSGKIPGMNTRQVMTSQGIFIAYALMQGFSKQGIDNAAHVGGLLAGCLLALLLASQLDGSVPGARRRQRAAGGALVCAVGVGVLVFTTPTPVVHHRQLFAFQRELSNMLPAMQGAESALNSDVKLYQAKKLTESQFMEAMKLRHVPAYQSVASRLEPLNLPENDTSASYLNDIRRSNRLMVDLMQLESGDPHFGNLSAAEKSSLQVKLSEEMKKISERMKQKNNDAKKLVSGK